MIFFYLWVVFLAAIMLAVPIVAFVEKSRVKKAAGYGAAAAGAVAAEAAFDDEPVAEVAAEVAGDGMNEFGGALPTAADDFSAFDDFN